MKNLFTDRKYLCWGLTAFFVIIGSILFFMLLQHMAGIRAALSKLMGILSPIIWGVVFSYLLQPIQLCMRNHLFDKLCTKLCKKRPELAVKLSRAITALISLILLIVVLSALLWMLLPQVYESLETLILNLPAYAQTIGAWVEDKLSSYPQLETVVIGFLSEVEVSITDLMQNSVFPRVESIIANLTTGVYRVVRAALNLLIGFVVAIYVLYNTDRCNSSLKRITYSIFSTEKAGHILKAFRFAHEVIMGFISGKIVDSLIIGVLCYIGCRILSIPYAVLVSVIVGVTNIIPFFGPFIGAVPSAFLILVISPSKCLVFVLFVFLLQQFDGNILGPRILGDAVGIKGFWIMFAIIVGGGLFGFIGMVMGVPVMTIILAAAHYLINNALEKRGHSTEREAYEKLDYIDPESGEMIYFTDVKKAASNGNISVESGDVSDSQ